MADPISEINTATQVHFMPLVTNQIFYESPALYRIFRIAKEGEFGMALPSFDGRSIAEPLEIGVVGEEVATYSTGTVTTTNGSTTVTLAGGTWPTNIANRGYITLADEKSYAIASRSSDTVILLETPYEGTGGAGQSYSATYYTPTANAVGSYGKDTTWGAGSGDVLGAANFSWKMYHSTLKIHNLDAEINKGRERLLDIVAIKMRNGMRGLRKALTTDFYSAQADGGNGMVGLRAICAETGTVGEIEKRKYSWWQGNVKNAGGADLNWTLLNEMWYKTKKYGMGDPATVILCSQGVLQKYEDNLSKVVVTGSSGTGYPNVYLQMQADKVAKTIDGGFRAFSFKQIPMISDLYCPAGYLFFVNENYLHWRVLKAFESTGWQQLRSQGKDWAQLTIFGYGALTVSACNKFGQISNLAEA